MGFEALFVLLTVLALLVTLACTEIPADIALLTAVLALMVVPVETAAGFRLGILSPSDALAGFSNEGLITIGLLFVVVRGLHETGAVDWIAHNVLGQPRTLRGALSRMVWPTTVISAFMNNTPLVALMIPIVGDWSRKLRFQPSKLMMPMCYATTLGGMCTLIGTSTNLLVAGLVASETNLPPLQMFDVTWVGVPCAIVGGIYLILTAPKLLPERGSVTSTLTDPREYIVEMKVSADSPMDGKTVEEAGLRGLPGLYLVEIERAGQSIAAVGPHHILKAADRLIFVGIVESIRDLQKLRGLVPTTNQVFKLDGPRYERLLFEAVVSNTSPLAGETIRDGRFRNRYQAVVLGVARNGERIQGKIGDIKLRAGDVLLAEASRDFADQHRNSTDFFLVSPLEGSTPRRHERAWASLTILTLMVLLASTGLMSMLLASAVAALLVVVTRCCTVSEARESVQWSVLIAIGAALGLGRGIEQSGAGQVVADSVLALAGTNPLAALVAIYVITTVVTELITNNAAVALVFPLAFATAERLGVNFMPFAMAVMIAGSAGFATPFGYQTNLMVYGPGGYRFSDYVRFGTPLDVIVGITALLVIPWVWPL
jgi:di/tricarboxylate transporter